MAVFLPSHRNILEGILEIGRYLTFHLTTIGEVTA